MTLSLFINAANQTALLGASIGHHHLVERSGSCLCVLLRVEVGDKEKRKVVSFLPSYSIPPNTLQ